MRITAEVRLVRNPARIPNRDPITGIPMASRISSGTMTRNAILMVMENRIRDTTLSAVWATISADADTRNKA